jgi:superfamily II DNA helicase RecQ
MNSALHFFTIPALSPQAAQAELNLFLQQQRVVAVEKQWVADGAASYWALCVTVVDGPGALPASLRAPGQGGKTGSPKVDYREVLNAADFTVFAELRNLRAGIATREGVPPYALFSNEQLATMVRQRVMTAEQLRAIDGVGEARVAKYAAQFLPLLCNAFASVT